MYYYTTTNLFGSGVEGKFYSRWLLRRLILISKLPQYLIQCFTKTTHVVEEEMSKKIFKMAKIYIQLCITNNSVLCALNYGSSRGCNLYQRTSKKFSKCNIKGLISKIRGLAKMDNKAKICTIRRLAKGKTTHDVQHLETGKNG